MEKSRLIIVGAGAYSVVVAETALLCGFTIVGFADDNKLIGTKIYNDIEIVSTISDFNNDLDFDFFIVAIGNNNFRKIIYEKLILIFTPVNIIHPKSIVSQSLSIGYGNVILAGTVINANAQIGDNNIINSLVLIDHDTVVHNHCHIAQGAIVGSNVDIGDNYMSELGDKISSFSILE